jgi:hypothetical protein
MADELGSVGGVNVTIRAGNQDLEVVAPLAKVVGIGSSGSTSPENTLDVDCARGIRATGGIRIETRVPFEV